MAPRTPSTTKRSARRDEPQIIVRGAREHNLRNVNVELPRDKLDRLHRPVRVGQVEPRLRHDLRRGPAPLRRVAQSPTPGSSSGRWTSPTSTSSRACRRRSRSTRSRRAATRGRPSARSPRSTTTSACCTPASACSTARTTARGCSARRRSRSSTASSTLPDGTRFQVLAPVVRGRKGEYDTLLEDLSGQGYVRARIDGEIGRHRRVPEARRAARAVRAAQDRDRRRPARAARGHRAAAHRLARDRAAARRRCRRGRARRRARARRRPRRSRSASTSPARCAARATTSRRRATSRSTRRTGRARRATGWARRSRSTPSWSSPTPSMSLNAGAIAPWRSAHTQYFTRMLESVAEVLRHRPRRAVGEAHRQAAEGHPARRQRQAEGQVQEPLRPHPFSTPPSTRA